MSVHVHVSSLQERLPVIRPHAARALTSGSGIFFGWALSCTSVLLLPYSVQAAARSSIVSHLSWSCLWLVSSASGDEHECLATIVEAMRAAVQGSNPCLL